MDEQTPGNPFVFEGSEPHGPSTAALRGEPLFSLGDRYLVYQVRRGGMGEVFLCRPTGMDEAPLLALKSFQKRFFFDPAIREAFVREIKIWSQLSGLPYIMPVWGVEFFDDRPFVVMLGIGPGGIESGQKIIDKGPDSSRAVTVRDVLKKYQGSLPLHLMFDYAYQTAAGMSIAQHSIADIVHGDLKPENLLLIGEIGLFISDFGLARIVSDGTREEHYLESTWAYRAPESWNSPGIVSQASDIYAFGVILYELLIGESPFHARTREEWSSAHQTFHPSPPPGFPQEGAAAACMSLALQCLSKESGDRPQGFASIRGELAQIGSRYFKGIQESLDAFRLMSTVVSFPQHKTRAITTLLASGQHEEALAELEKIPKEAFDATLWHLLGNALSLNERDTEAIVAFEQALQEGTTDPAILSDYALSLKRLGRFREAIAIYEDLLKRAANDKSYVQSSINLAGVYLESRKLRTAVDHLKGLLRKHPREPQAWFSLGEAYGRGGQYDDAVKCYRQALALAPQMVEVHMRLASALMDVLGRAGEALSVLELAQAQGEQSYAWGVRFIACHAVLGHEEYVEAFYHEHVRRGWSQAQITELQDDVRQRVECVRNAQIEYKEAKLSSQEDEIGKTDTRFPKPNPKRILKLLDMLEHPDSSGKNVITDGNYGKDVISLPFINIRYYISSFGREYSIDFYDDVLQSDYVDHFLSKQGEVIRDEVHTMARDGTLRPNLFYFTICPHCGIAILTNRDPGKELRCRACNTVHNTAESKREDLRSLLTHIHNALGTVPMPMKGLLQVLLVQPYEASSMPLVEAICTASGFTQAEESLAYGLIWNEGRLRGIFSSDHPFSVWQKIAEGGERAGDDGTPPEVDAVLQKLRSLTPTRSLCLVLNTKDAGIAGLLIEGQLEQAEVALQGKLSEGENIADKLRSLITNLMLQKRFLEAREKVMALLQLRPDEEQAWATLGIIEMEREQYHAAIDALEQARSINPTKWLIPLFLAQCYEKLGDADKTASYASLAYNLGAVSFQI